MDISQQQFELFIKLHTEPKELKDRLATINSGKNYRNAQTDIMWIAWEESRNSLKPVGFTNEDELNYREKEETNGFVLLLVMHGSAVPVTDDIYTLE